MKRILKALLKGIVGMGVLIGVCYGGFHLWEFATGGKYIAYLKANSETIPLAQSFDLGRMDEDIEANRLILVGEIHGFGEPQKFDYVLFTYLHSKHNVQNYFAELDFVQAIVLNQYLSTGDETFLNDALRKWAVIQGRNNKGYFDKYRKLQAYYSQLPEEEKFSFRGVDCLNDLPLTASYLAGLMPSSTDSATDAPDANHVLHQLNLLDSVYKSSPDTLFELAHIRKNLQYALDRENRETVMFENFRGLHKRFLAENEKGYGYFGLNHVFQYQVNGQHPMASQLRTSDLGLEGRILSINFMMNDSYMVMPSNQLPEFMRDKGAYTRMPISSDVMLFVYIYGVKDFKRMTPEHHKSLIKMNGDDSPYATSNRMTTTIQLLPVTEKMEMDENGKPYVQYTVFVRNSDWAEPQD